MREQAVLEVAVDAIDGEAFFNDFVVRNQPLVVRGAIGDWPALSLWNDDYLRERLADYQVLTAHLGASSPLRFMPGNGEYREMSMAEFLDGYSHDERVYLTDTRVPASLRGDLGSSPFLEAFERLADVEKRTAMYLSHDQRITQLHYDDEENLYCVVDGRKRFQLFDPMYLRHLYPYQDNYRMDHSKLDLDAIDEARFPKAHEAIKRVVELGKGDLLYLPCGWWHQVESRDRSLAVSFVRLDGDRLFAMFLRLVERGCIRVTQSTRRLVAALVTDPQSASPFRFQQWCDDPLVVALVRYRLCRRHGSIGDRDTAIEVRDVLAQRVRTSGFNRSSKYLIQNVFAIPLEREFIR